MNEDDKLYRQPITEQDNQRFDALCRVSKSKKWTDDEGNTYPCKIWIGATNLSKWGRKKDRYGNPNKGYGVFHFGPRGANVYAHRFAYFREVGSDPGWSTEHLCHNTLCVEPMHLIGCTPAENNRTRYPVIHPKCQNGHIRTIENTYIWPENGKRDCRDCWNIRDKKRDANCKREDGTYNRITEELLLEVAKLREQNVPWREIGRQVKVSPQALKYHFKKMED